MTKEKIKDLDMVKPYLYSEKDSIELKLRDDAPQEVKEAYKRIREYGVPYYD